MFRRWLAPASSRGFFHRPPGFLLLALAWAQLFSLPVPARACSCVVVADSHPCESLQTTDVVFLGRTVEVRETSRTVVTDDGHSYDQPIRKFRFEVQERLVGNPPTTVVVETGGGGGDCGYSFEIGYEYLVYAAELNQGRLTTNICTRTRPAADAAPDLEHGRRIAAGKAPTLIYGTTRWFRGRSGSFEQEPIKGAKVEAEDRKGKVHRAATDSEGRFQLEVPRGGRYQLRASWPPEIPEADDVVVNLEKGTCAAAHWTVDLLPRAHGLLIGADGSLAPGGIELTVIPTDGRQAPPESTYSRDDGTFELTLSVSGEFLLVARSPYGHQYPTVYYPGTEDPEQAVPLTLLAGDRIDVGTFTLTAPREEIELHGVVLRPDGSAASHVRFLIFVDDKLEQPIQTNERGEFSFRAFSGLTYSFRPYTSRDPAKRLLPTERRPEKEPGSSVVEIELLVEG